MSDHQQYVLLGVAEDLFAAPVEQVQEILDMRAIARLPQAPVNLLGMIDVRGEGVPVLDLRLTLGLAEIANDENTRILVLKVSRQNGSLTVGLKTDRVLEVAVLDDAGLDPPPSINGSWDGNCIAGIGRRNGRFVTVVDLERLVGAREYVDLERLVDGDHRPLPPARAA